MRRGADLSTASGTEQKTGRVFCPGVAAIRNRDFEPVQQSVTEALRNFAEPSPAPERAGEEFARLGGARGVLLGEVAHGVDLYVWFEETARSRRSLPKESWNAQTYPSGL